MSVVSLMSTGSLFHAFGPATENARSEETSLLRGTNISCFAAQCYLQLSPGGISPSPRIPIPPPQKNTQNTKKNIKKCIEFTPQICVSPRTWSLELKLTLFAAERSVAPSFPDPQYPMTMYKKEMNWQVNNDST